MNDIRIDIHKRRLPHLYVDGVMYFVTFKTLRHYDDKHEVLSEEEMQLVLEVMKERSKDNYTLVAFVILDTHVHLLLIPKRDIKLSKITREIKGKSARKINILRNKINVSVWQDESFDRIVRNDGEFTQTFEYMLNNPVKRGLTEDPFTYKYWYFNERFEEELC
jgi:putative transposase